MKKIFTLAAIVMAAFPTQAQLKVGLPPGPPQPSALLDASNTGAATKTGFLALQVQLTGTADVTTIAAPAAGLMIYNLSAAGIGAAEVTAGYYYFNGVKWKPFISEVPPAKPYLMLLYWATHLPVLLQPPRPILS